MASVNCLRHLVKTMAGARKSRPFKETCVRAIKEKVEVRQIIIPLLQFDTQILLAEATTREKPTNKNHYNNTAV
jgi:hypothetical protein